MGRTSTLSSGSVAFGGRRLASGLRIFCKRSARSLHVGTDSQKDERQHSGFAANGSGTPGLGAGYSQSCESEPGLEDSGSGSGESSSAETSEPAGKESDSADSSTGVTPQVTGNAVTTTKTFAAKPAKVTAITLDADEIRVKDGSGWLKREALAADDEGGPDPQSAEVGQVPRRPLRGSRHRLPTMSWGRTSSPARNRAPMRSSSAVRRRRPRRPRASSSTTPRVRIRTRRRRPRASSAAASPITRRSAAGATSGTTSSSTSRAPATKDEPAASTSRSPGHTPRGSTPTPSASA